MERIEKNLKKQMNSGNTIPYPDFDQMWSSIERDELKVSGGESLLLRPRKRKRIALVAGISIALMATPVYAAFQYDWSSLLTYRAGIQSALEQGLGQNIAQSVTRDGITLTVHTAFTDENRTFLLYSLDPGSSEHRELVSYGKVGMQDRNGNWIEGNSAHDWNAREGVFQGYFETDWVAKDNQIEVAFTLTDIRFVGEVEKPLAFDPLQSKQQTVAIEQDGIGSITLQSFEQPEGKTMLKSAIAFTDPQAQENNWVRIQAINGHNEQLKETEPSIYGTPGEHGEILNQQVFQREALLAEGTRFQIAYLADVAKAEGTWSVPMVLSKKQLENGSFKEKLDIALEQVPGGTTIEGMVVTPTQVRLNLRHEEKYSRLPYMDYQLDVGGTLIQGGWWLLSNQPHQSELRFEMAGLDPSALADQPVSLIAKHRVDDHEGDGTPIRLTNISTDKQFISSNVAGHAITWSYYMKEHNLYVESYSADRQFGGVNQTYYLSGDQRNYGKPAFTGMVGDGNNQHTDVYENFEGTELEIFIWRYMTEKPDDELRIQLK